MTQPRPTTQLVERFRDVGLRTGDSVIVHASFRSLKPHVRHPEDVIEALLQCIGDRGNLMLPTFNYSSPLPKPYYDPRITPARTGIIAECGRKRADALRSLHPTHSVAVVGPDAVALTREHLIGRAFGVNSPLDRLAQRDGKVLLLGVGHTANSMVHVGEERAAVCKPAPHDPMPRAKLRMPDDRIAEHRLDTSPSCSAAFEVIAHPLRRGHLIQDGRVGDCLIQLMSGHDVIDIVVELLREDPTILLCTSRACATCRNTWAAMQASVCRNATGS